VTSPVVLAYAGIARTEAGARTPLDVLAWVFTVRERATSGVLPAAALVRDGVTAALESWVTLVPLHALRAGRAGAGVLAGLGAIVLGLGLAASWIARGRSGFVRAASARPRFAAIAAGLAAVIAFVCWYQPGNHVFWVFAPPFALALLAPVAPAPTAPRRRVAIGALALAAAVVLFANLAFRVLPARDPARAPYADLLVLAREWLRPGDLLVTDPGTGVVREGAVALPVLARVEVWMVPRAGGPARAPFERELAAAIARVHAAGGRVHATGESRGLVERFAGPARAVAPVRGDTLWRCESPR
jgi:hypothetical protein